jgi:hypothetical protein
MEQQGPTEQELAALDIILRGGDEVRAVVGTFAGEDAAFVVQVTEEPESGNVRVWPLAVFLRDEHLPFVGGPRESASEAGDNGQSDAAREADAQADES